MHKIKNLTQQFIPQTIGQNLYEITW